MSTKKVLLVIGILFLVIPCVGCGLLYVRDWYYTEVRYQNWLQGNELRVDWGHFSSPAEARDAILSKIPVNAQEEKLQNFYLANVEGTTVYNWDNLTRKYHWNYETGKFTFVDKMGGLGSTYCPNSMPQEKCLIIKIEMPLIESGHFLRRHLTKRWTVFLYINYQKQALVDVKVQKISAIERIILGSLP